jgi:hypothetical protein
MDIINCTVKRVYYPDIVASCIFVDPFLCKERMCGVVLFDRSKNYRLRPLSMLVTGLILPLSSTLNLELRLSLRKDPALYATSTAKSSMANLAILIDLL